MIHSEQRSLLTDALTPPAGFVFEAGFATTFSMDLVTLLTLPLHLAWLGAAQGENSAPGELPVFEALRRTSDRLTVFCHAGRMSIPRVASPLFALLEGMVHEALPIHGGAFHPKVWILKFSGTLRNQMPRLRVLVLSRNLTEDRSWDLSLSLDGVVGNSVQVSNAPLAELIQHARAISRRPLSEQRESDLEVLTKDVQQCVWELPQGFKEIRFHALGIAPSRKQWLPEADRSRWDELGVISPFVTEGALKKLASLTRTPLFLLCRADEMDKLPAGTEQLFQSTQVLSLRAEAGDEEDHAGTLLSGLHAKVFVGKRGPRNHLVVGSANATDAALLNGSNVEFIAELISKSADDRGPADWLGKDGLGSYLETYTRSPPSETKEDRQIADRLEEVRDALVRAKLQLQCSQQDEQWLLALDWSGEDLQCPGVEVQVWPLSIDQSKAAKWPGEPTSCSLDLGLLAEHEVTTFTGFKLKLKDQELSFALNLPAHGLPHERVLSILRNALRNRDGFVRYLLLLLGSWEGQAEGQEAQTPGVDSSWSAGAAGDVPLFEMLAQAYAKDPARLSQIASILKKLEEQGTDEEDIVPSEFRAMWKSFEQAMQEDATQ